MGRLKNVVSSSANDANKDLQGVVDIDDLEGDLHKFLEPMARSIDEINANSSDISVDIKKGTSWGKETLKSLSQFRNLYQFEVSKTGGVTLHFLKK